MRFHNMHVYLQSASTMYNMFQSSEVPISYEYVKISPLSMFLLFLILFSKKIHVLFTVI